MTSQQKLKACYWAFALCVVTSTIPQMTVQTFSMIFSIAMIIAFYVVRKKWAKESFEHKEASFLIKTFWIWSALYVVGIFVAGLLISTFGDMSAIHEWTQNVVENGAMPDEEGMKQVTLQYMEANFWLIMEMTLLGILPAQIYAIWRSKAAITRIMNPTAPVPEAVISQ